MKIKLKKLSGIKIKDFLKVLNLDDIDYIDIFDKKSKGMEPILSYNFNGKDSWNKSLGVIDPIVGNKIITEINYRTSTDSVRYMYSTHSIIIWCK